MIRRAPALIYHYERDGRVCVLFTCRNCIVRYHCRICSRLHDDMNGRDACERSHNQPVNPRAWGNQAFWEPEVMMPK